MGCLPEAEVIPSNSSGLADQEGIRVWGAKEGGSCCPDSLALEGSSTLLTQSKLPQYLWQLFACLAGSTLPHS